MIRIPEFYFRFRVSVSAISGDFKIKTYIVPAVDLESAWVLAWDSIRSNFPHCSIKLLESGEYYGKKK